MDEITDFCSRVIEDAKLKAAEAEGHAALAEMEGSSGPYSADQVRSYGEALKALGTARGAVGVAHEIATMLTRRVRE